MKSRDGIVFNYITMTDELIKWFPKINGVHKCMNYELCWLMYASEFKHDQNNGSITDKNKKDIFTEN
jgi:hypothetical protein